MKDLPIGIESFKCIIKDGYYYVDKTLFIKDFLENRDQVKLFTRLRSILKFMIVESAAFR